MRAGCETLDVIDVELPHTEGVPDVVRSMAACIASATETPVSQVPQPEADLHAAIAAWRSWLAGRGAGLIPLADPARFNWPDTGWPSWEMVTHRRRAV